MPVPEPVIVYPAELPVSAARDEIARAIRDNQVVIVAGATGSGKTTQLPKICLELGRTRIAHTQPRRIAARTIAERIAEELQVPLGSTVGYKVRFTDKVSEDTRVALMTDGILLNEIHRDRLLRRYDTIIVDEAHERSLNVDFLIGYLQRILPKRPDLKVIVTSATIDPESFAKHFAAMPRPDAGPDHRGLGPDLSGRDPLPPFAGSGDRATPAPEERDDVDGIVAALRELDREPAGDVLVFLPGEAEIRDAADAVRGMYAKDAAPTEVLPLYGRLSSAEQHRVFERSTVAGVRRRVILATNVAETSLTVPGIRYVVDTGTARISRYSNRTKIQQLPIEPVSQASAQQRSGRAGRTAPGIAIRLYGEDDFATRDEYTEPEILRTSLASVILQMLSLGFGDISAFPFLTPPDSRGVKAAIDLLVELGAVTTGPKLTDLGREISRLPIDPRFARMLVEAKRTGVLPDVLAIVVGHVHPGRPRASRGPPRRGRPPARPVHRSDERLPQPAEPLEPPAGAAGRARVERLPPAVPLRAPQLRARPGMGRRPPAAQRHRGRAPARRGTRRRPIPTTSIARSSRGCCRTSASSTSARRRRRSRASRPGPRRSGQTRAAATTSARAARGSRSSPARG